MATLLTLTHPNDPQCRGVRPRACRRPEAPTGEAFKAFNRDVGTAVSGGRSQHTPDDGRLNLPASGVITGVVAPSVVRPTPKSSFYGMERRKKL